MTDEAATASRNRRFAEISRFQTWMRRIIAFSCTACGRRRELHSDDVYGSQLTRKMVTSYGDGSLFFPYDADLDSVFRKHLACTNCGARSAEITYLSDDNG